MECAFEIRPVKAVLGLDLVSVFDSEELLGNGRIAISGEAVLVAVSDIVVSI